MSCTVSVKPSYQTCLSSCYCTKILNSLLLIQGWPLSNILETKAKQHGICILPCNLFSLLGNKATDHIQTVLDSLLSFPNETEKRPEI